MKQFKRWASVFVCALLLLMNVSVVTSAKAAATSNQPATVKLKDLHYTESHSTEVISEITDSYGNVYKDNILRFDARDSGYITFDLMGEYTSMTVKVVASTETNSSSKMNLGIFLDTKLVEDYAIKTFTRQQSYILIELNLTGVNTLQIKTSSNDVRDSWIFMTEGVLTKASTPAVNLPDWAVLHSTVVVDSKNFYYSSKLFTDAYGDLHLGHLRFDSRWEPAFALFNIDGQYETLSANFAASSSTSAHNTFSINVYLDESKTPAYSKNGLTKTSTDIGFKNLNVLGVKTVRVEITSTDTYQDSNYYMTDAVLMKHQHTLDAWTVKTPATCSALGVNVQYCTSCGAEVTQEPIPMIPHTPSAEWTVTKPATCSAQGEQSNYCTICGSVTEVKPVERIAHTNDVNWIDVVEATCQQEGRRILKCVVCTATVEEEILKQLPHTPSEQWKVITEATCTLEGQEGILCTVCSTPQQTRAIPMTDHEYGEWNKISGSIWNTPIVKERTCLSCNKIQHSENSLTFWLKPLVLTILTAFAGCAAVVAFIIYRRDMPYEWNSVVKIIRPVLHPLIQRTTRTSSKNTSIPTSEQQKQTNLRPRDK